MKTLLNSILLFCFALCSVLPQSLTAQKGETAKEIVFMLAPSDFKKSEKVKKAKEYNAMLKEVLEQYWTLDFPFKLMPRKGIYKYARSGDGIIVAEFNTMSSVGDIRTETTFDIRKKSEKLLLSVRLPSFGLKKVDIVYAVMHAQFMYKNLYKFKKPTKELPKMYGHILKKKTLLISEDDLSRKLTEADIKNIYPHKFKIVSASEIEDAIFNRDENNVVLYRASDSGIVTEANFPYWNIYQPNDGVVITRHSGGETKGLSKADVVLFVKRTSQK